MFYGIQVLEVKTLHTNSAKFIMPAIYHVLGRGYIRAKSTLSTLLNDLALCALRISSVKLLNKHQMTHVC